MLKVDHDLYHIVGSWFIVALNRGVFDNTHPVLFYLRKQCVFTWVVMTSSYPLVCVYIKVNFT